MNSQIRIVRENSSILKIFVKQHNFLAGQLDTSRRTFYHVPRSHKNLFHLFKKDGLGMNQEILLREDFDLIRVKFCDQLLTTHRKKWLNQGVKSPFCNSLVDLQIILPLSEINMNNTEIYFIRNSQIDLFQGGNNE